MFVSILSAHLYNTAVIFDEDTEELKQVYIGNLFKPESPEEKEKRLREEAVKEMFSYWSEDEEAFVSGNEDDHWVKQLMYTLYDEGYQKKVQ